MPARPTRGAKMMSLELDEGLIDRVKTYATDRDETIRQVVTRALERELLYPPPDAPPAPFPDSPAAKAKKSK